MIGHGSRIPSIDGLRGIAALIVVIYHGSPTTFDQWDTFWYLRPGFLGVRLFFVLSGALISGLLWNMRDEGRTFGQTWRRFAYRRALRILPLAYLTMALIWWVGLPAMRETPGWYLTFTSNIGRSLYVEWPVGLGHFWTLAVEEQVYLLWPIGVLLVPVHRWPVVAIVLIIASPIARAYAWHVELWANGSATFLLLDGFAAGSLIAWSQRHYQGATMAVRLGAAGLVTIAFAMWLENNVGWAMVETGLVLCLAGIVGWAWCNPRQRVLSWAPLVWVGTISYGVYVWHEAAPTVIWHLGLLPFGNGWRMIGLKLACGLGVAALTWYGFERPINRLKDRASVRVARPTRQVSDPLLAHTQSRRWASALRASFRAQR